MGKKIIIAGVESEKTKQIIIAKYKENISWVKDLIDIPSIVYDKYNKNAPHYLPNIPTFPVQDFEGIRYTKSPTGRESHSYLYHIIKHYDNLADMNIFLQGSPSEIDSDARIALRIQFLRDFDGVNFLPLNFPLVFCDKRAAPLHTGLPLERVFNRLFQNPCPDLFTYSWGAMFCVTREFIRKRPLAFYEEMMEIIYDEPLSGYVYERLWPTILACHSFIPHASYPKRNRDLWGMPSFSISKDGL